MMVGSAVLRSEVRDSLTKKVTCEGGGVHAMLIIKSILFQMEEKQIHNL